MITNHAHFKRMAAFFRVTQSGINAGVGKRHDDIHIGIVFTRQFMPQTLAAKINILTENLAVGTGEINQLKNAVTMLNRRKRIDALYAFVSL